VIDGTDRGSIAEVTTYNTQLVRPALQELRGAKRDVVV
jgi:hypothetical protein